MHRLWLGLVAVLVLAGLAPAATAGTDRTEQRGLSVVAVKQLSPRLLEYVVHSRALAGDATVRIQLPSAYGKEPGRRWPLALLLHGRSENGRTWSEQAHTAQFDGMVLVMPDGGRVGWYTDWYDDSCCGPLRQHWETFHLDELLPWVQRTFRVSPRRSQHFIAGDSMGGYGAMAYAARRPDLFGGAAELSGFVDLMLLGVSGFVGVDGQSYQVAGTPPGAIFGPRQSQEVRWRGRNPVDLADNLRHTDLVLRHGNGLPGRFGGSPDAGEAAIRQTGISLHDRLTSLGIPHVWEDYGNGTHTWPYWEWGLQRVWPRWLKLAAADAPDPTAFSYRSTDPTWSVYGWDVLLRRGVAEFASLAVSSPEHFTVTGSGSAMVTTAAAFHPHAAYALSTGQTVRADSAGRLHVLVDLGPSHSAQEYTPPAQALETAEGAGYFRSVTVTVTRLSR